MTQESDKRMISVIVPAYNAATTITPCVAALCRQQIDEPFELIVVDDGSEDETAALAQAAGATVLRIPRGRPAAARNAGIHAACGDIVCFTDADCVPTADWLANLTAPFADPEVAACKGSYLTHQKEIVARFVQLEYEDKYDLLRKQATIDFIDTYSAAYRREILLANDGFDEQFPYLEDQELSFRLAARGYKMLFRPAAVVYHRHSNTVRAYLRKKLIIGYWKAQVVRRFPERGVKDSHTPQVMKLQMLLIALTGLLAAGALGLLLLLSTLCRTAVSACPAVAGVAAAVSGTLATATLLVFLATTIPFVTKAWSKDRAVALAAPFMLALRAIGLGLGYGWGLVQPALTIRNPDDTIGGLHYLGKRLLDIVGAAVGLIFTLIVWFFVAPAIKLDSQGPVIFRQVRVGQGGRLFTLYKFRTMNANATEELAELIARRGLTEPVLKLADDPRLTRIGRFLRRWSLDELPQFWNVLKGDMSLVGPRPEEERVVAHYNDWHRRRLAVKPGMTGPMQVNGRAELSLDERVALELDYIEHYSLGRDLHIIGQTLPAVIKGKGAL